MMRRRASRFSLECHFVLFRNKWWGVGGAGGGIVFVGQFGVCLTVLPSSSTSTNDMMRSFISGSLTLTPFVLTKFCRNEFSLMIYIHTYTLLRSLLFHYYLFFFFLMSARGGGGGAAAGFFFGFYS
jgi:hypothetical protein